MIKLKKKIIQKDPKPKIAMKTMRIKIKIKNKLEDINNFFIKRWNWKNEDHIEKKISWIEIKGWN